MGRGPEGRVIQFGCVHVHIAVDEKGVSDSCVRLCMHAFRGGGGGYCSGPKDRQQLQSDQGMT